jgi:hypothetical protein
MEQSLRRTQISYETAKAGELKRMTIVSQHFVLGVTQSLTKAQE